MTALGSVEIQVMVLAQLILAVANSEWRCRIAPYKLLKVTSTGKMSCVPSGFGPIGPFSGVFVVEYASMSFLLTPLNPNQSDQTSATT